MSVKKLALGWWFVWLWGAWALVGTQMAAAQDALPQDALPLEISLTLSRLEAKSRDPIQAILVLQNSSSFTLTNVMVQLQDDVFTAVAPNVSETVSPFSGEQVEYELTSSEVGTHQVVFVVSYEWEETAITRQHLEIVSEKVAITPRWFFDWPGFLMPLFAGAAITLAVGWFTDRRKEKQEDRLHRQQAIGVVVALLQAANKNVHWPYPDPVDFDLWEEVVIKGHLFSALNQFGRDTGYPDLSRQLVELSVTLADYNKRQANNNLTENHVNELRAELTAVLTSLGTER